MWQLFCSRSAPASSSLFSSKCICSTENCALQELLLAQTICCSFTKTRLGMKNSRVLPGISGTRLWKQMELIVFSCLGQGVPSPHTGSQGSILSLSGKEFPRLFCEHWPKQHGLSAIPRLNTPCCECSTRRGTGMGFSFSMCFGKKTRSDFQAEIRLDEAWMLCWSF